MSFLQSKTISHFQIVLPRENAYRVIGQIGRIGNTQLKGQPLEPNKMAFLAQAKLCEEQLERVRIIQADLHARGHPLPKEHVPKKEYHTFLEMIDRKYRLSGQSHIHMLERAAEDLELIWKNKEDLEQRKKCLEEEDELFLEELHIYQGGIALFGNNLFGADKFSLGGHGSKIGFKCGVIYKRDEIIIKRTVFRISRGHSVLFTIDQNSRINQKQKRVLVYIFYGFGTSRIMQEKVQKIIDGYSIKAVEYPKTQQQLIIRMQRIKQSLLENSKLKELVDLQLKNAFAAVLEVIPSGEKIKFTRLEYFKLFFLQQKFIYQQLNQIKIEHSYAHTQIYIQSQHIDQFTLKLQEMLVEDRMPIPQLIPILDADKPTLFELNQYTHTPYQILTAYGVPRYKEINPSVFNLITFPFLFGVMFSDIAHGSILLGLGLTLIMAPDFYENNPIGKALIPHRLCIALMGFFAIYCGFIYNEYLSIGLNLFGSCYSVVDNEIVYRQSCVYPLGIDPIWSISANQLQFTNSLKMKIAVIIAVVHMSLGIFLKGINQYFQRKKIFIILETLPQLIFFLSLFGYMDFLIIYKWLKQWLPQNAPSVITTIINLPLKLGKTEDCCGGQPFWGKDNTDTSQNTVQIIILFASFACVPLILCLKPIYVYSQRKRKIANEMLSRDLEADLQQEKARSNRDINQDLLLKDQEQHQMSEVIVHQIIETIQFVLGCISNTASYLRLWALSLAHEQLSSVFFQETVQIGLLRGYSGIILNLLLFPVFASVTFGILICMDSLQCFLHTLRLHWVQFQNKFYRGDGRELVVFNVEKLSNEWMGHR